MYLKHIRSGGYDYYRIMKNYRDDDGKVRQKTIMNLGRLSDEEAERTRKWVKGFPVRDPDSITTSLENIKPVGALDQGDNCGILLDFLISSIRSYQKIKER